MTLKTLAAAACLSICTATAGSALTVPVTVGGIDYDVTTITGTFLDNQALLMEQVWWGDFTLAYMFTTAVGVNLGTPNSFLGVSSGPYFAYTQDHAWSVQKMAWVPDLMDFDVFRASIFQELTYAIVAPVSAVPLPAGGLLLVTALGGIAALKRRKKGSA